MTSLYTGDGDAIPWPRSVAFSSASRTTPIVITTSAPHGFETRNQVAISGTSLTEAIGLWIITKLTNTTFSLNGSSTDGPGSPGSAGTATNYSLPSFPILSDGDTGDAAHFNLGSVALGDQVQFLAMQVHRLDGEDDALADAFDVRADAVEARATALEGRATAVEARATALETLTSATRALNFQPKSVTGVMNFAFFDKLYGWLMCGNNEVVAETGDWGNTITASIVAAAGAGENCLHGASDPTGNAVFSSATRYIFERTKATNAVTKVDVYGSAVTMDESLVAYDAVRSKFVWYGRVLGTASVKTSPDRTTWTPVSVPTFATGSVPKRMAANPTSGRVLFVGYTSSPETFYISRTDNAGTSWSVTSITTGLADPENVSLVYNADQSEWLLAASRSSSSQYTRVWRSADDGVTWTLVTSLTNARFTSIAAIGGLWVALAKGVNPYSSLSDLVWSTDQGATWNKAGVAFDSPTGIFSGGGSFVVVGTLGTAFFGHRMGRPSLGTVT